MQAQSVSSGNGPNVTAEVQKKVTAGIDVKSSSGGVASVHTPVTNETVEPSSKPLVLEEGTTALLADLPSATIEAVVGSSPITVASVTGLTTPVVTTDAGLTSKKPVIVSTSISSCSPVSNAPLSEASAVVSVSRTMLTNLPTVVSPHTVTSRSAAVLDNASSTPASKVVAGSPSLTDIRTASTDKASFNNGTVETATSSTSTTKIAVTNDSTATAQEISSVSSTVPRHHSASTALLAEKKALPAGSNASDLPVSITEEKSDPPDTSSLTVSSAVPTSGVNKMVEGMDAGNANIASNDAAAPRDSEKATDQVTSTDSSTEGVCEPSPSGVTAGDGSTTSASDKK